MRASLALHLALCAALLATIPTPSGASADSSRGHAFEFLRLSAEPIGRALAASHVASVEGPAALAWNPAGLAEGGGSAVLLAHASWAAGTVWEWGALSLRRGSSGFGLACGVLRAGA